jgi:DNA-binding transcriptional MerR regulator
LGRLYRIHEFAELAGVTVKALHHYDRLGLLKPERTDGGYRMYAERDLERLEQIIALKFLGVPLKQIKIVLDRPALELPDTLRLQLKALEEKHQLLSRAIRAIRAAEDALNTGRATEPVILKRIIQVIEMQNEIDVMKKYYGTAQAWEQRRRFYEEGPSPEWRELYRDVAAALGEDPAGEVAQALADRWLKLSLRAYNGEPEFQTDSPTAWMDREHWPPFMKRRITEFKLEEVTTYISQVVLSSRKKYFSESGWVKFEEIQKDPAQVTITWQGRVDVFREAEACLGEDLNSDKAQALAVRWMTYIDTASGEYPEVRAGLRRVWADRRNWTATVRYLEEALSMMTGERFDNVAAFIDATVDSNVTGTPGESDETEWRIHTR